MSKIVRHTAARRDQDHIKLIVQQNPQIPDRTEHLVGAGSDPTIALYATCKRLAVDEADFIAIPCNTAHAFVDRIQRHLAVPIVNMLDEAARFVREQFGTQRTVGLAATSGTVASRVYHDALAREGLRMVVPAAPYQARVMNAIYGERGVKAGFTTGEPLDELLTALEHLVRDKGADVLMLGCTELPLLIGQDEAGSVAGETVPVLDPTEILAKRCIALARDQAT